MVHDKLNIAGADAHSLHIMTRPCYITCSGHGLQPAGVPTTSQLVGAAASAMDVLSHKLACKPWSSKPSVELVQSTEPTAALLAGVTVQLHGL